MSLRNAQRFWDNDMHQNKNLTGRCKSRVLFDFDDICRSGLSDRAGFWLLQVPVLRVWLLCLSVWRHVGCIASNLGIRTRLQAMIAKVKAASTFERPRSFVLVSPPGFFTQPKISSMRLRMRWLIA